MFFLFGGSNYYPCGGWNDLIGIFATKEEALVKAQERDVSYDYDEPLYEWCHIIDGNSLIRIY